MQELSEKESTIIGIIDYVQIMLALPLLCYVLFLFLFVIFASATPGPYHLYSLTYNDHQYNVMLAPYWKDDAQYTVYECSMQGEECVKYQVTERKDSAENFWDIAE